MSFFFHMGYFREKFLKRTTYLFEALSNVLKILHTWSQAVAFLLKILLGERRPFKRLVFNSL
jgi:hypothetical protein